MFIKIALSAAIVLGAAAMASAATKSNKLQSIGAARPLSPPFRAPPDFPTPTVRQPRAVAALAIIKTSTTGDEKSQAVEFVQKRLSALSKSLGDKSYLDGDRFTAGDLMMTTVLRILKHTDIVTSEQRLAAYVERCTSRPAFKRAFDAQIGDFRKAA